MKRREFITLVGAAALTGGRPPTLQAQEPPRRLWRVGIIAGGIRIPAFDGFLQGMRELGHAEGVDYIADWRFADGRYARFADFAREFVERKEDVIFVGTGAAVDLVRQVTRAIPIVMGYSMDPVGAGYVANLARPGGNVTGLASSPDDSAAKHLELLAAVVPNLRRVGLLLNPEDTEYSTILSASEEAARAAGLTLVAVDAGRPTQIDEAFAVFAREAVQAVKVADDSFFFTQPERIAGLALRARLPAVFSQRDYVAAGGLMSYGESLRDFYYRGASFVDRILKGAKPSELPIELPARQLVINRKTARALSLTIPPVLYAAAREVIE
jgi:putative ABC transport system substrate-binding protein